MCANKLPIKGCYVKIYELNVRPLDVSHVC